jgi:hypothetical protein
MQLKMTDSDVPHTGSLNSINVRIFSEEGEAYKAFQTREIEESRLSKTLKFLKVRIDFI